MAELDPCAASEGSCDASQPDSLCSPQAIDLRTRLAGD